MRDFSRQNIPHHRGRIACIFDKSKQRSQEVTLIQQLISSSSGESVKEKGVNQNL